jgi:uncharacterized membrane protein YgcG
MRKSTMFISAALTAFVLAILAGVVTAYKQMSVPAQQAAQPPAATPQPIAMQVAVPTQQTFVQAQDAATIASTYINRTDLFSVELADFNGSQAYKVTFSSGDIVYVSMIGQVLAAQPPPAPIVVVVKKPSNNGGSNGVGGGGGSGGGEHEGGDD